MTVKPKNQEEQTERIRFLADSILKHKRAYYAGTPEISDASYDQLEEELKTLSPHHPVLSLVGAEPIETIGRKIKHDRPMLSLQKTYSFDDLLSWADFSINKVIIGTYKIDGNSLSLMYEKGKLVLAKTRGNGIFGEEVTEKVKWVPDIPGKLSKPLNIEIRGELHCLENQFHHLANEMVSLNLERPSSARNIISGLLGRKSHFELARFFNFFAFDFLSDEVSCSTVLDQNAELQSLGFSLPHPQKLESPSDVKQYLEHVKETMENSEIGLDGAVFSYNDLSLHEDLGTTSHHPRYKMSFKWPGQTAKTIVKDFLWETSRLGFITPVAIVEPVFLSGANITNVTLHNAAFVKTYNLKIGDEIEIIRSGEVIPKFLSVIASKEGVYSWPQVCPSCKTPLIFDDVRLKCPNNLFCPAQQLRDILNWISAVEIEDLSEKRLAMLVELGLVKSKADLYRLSIDDLLKMPLTKEKMAQKLFDNIQKSRTLSLVQFLNGLGIEGAGTTTWEKLLSVFPSLERLKKASISDIQKIDGFAEKSAEQIVRGLEAKSPSMDELFSVGVSPTQPDVTTSVSKESLPLFGKQFVITGALSKPRSEIEKAIKAAGGHIGSAVSKNTFALVTNEVDSTSSKMKKAKELNLTIWSEEQLSKILSNS